VILFQFIKIHPLETSYIKQVDLFPQVSNNWIINIVYLNILKKYNKGQKIVSGLFSWILKS
jgi:hypothetical protein